jgi:transcriptional regulator GlxA family with amidase domain
MFAKLLVAVVAISGLVSLTHAKEEPDAKLTLPSSGILKAAFVISDGATLIDIAGPMQTFDQVQSPGQSGIQTFTVSRSKAPIKAGTLTVIPDYTFADAPDVDIVVVGAQSGNDENYLGYIRQMNAKGKLMLSVCTGVSKFAQAGILDGKDATSHHDFIADFQKRFPKIHFVNDKAWVHSAPTIYTAGGETSGIELALHIIELYWDHDTAVKTARYMEYRGPDWQQQK